jgi:simple sugar transport system permease protein
MSYRLRRMPRPSTRGLLIGSVLAVVLALVVAAVILALSGRSVGDAYLSMYAASFGSPQGWQATLTRTAPLALTALAVTTALRMQLWNIGGEGQLLIGATGATAVALALPDLPAPLLLLVMMLAALAGAAAWTLIAAVPRATLGVNEIVVTLFLNYIAVRVVSLLVYGPWRDPGAVGFAYSRPVPEGAQIGSIPGTSVSWAVVLVVVVAALLWLLLERSRWGFSVDVAGGNAGLTRYLGFSYTGRVLAVMAVSGALAGLAGLVQLSGSTGRLQPDLAAGYGYAGILVAFLAGRSIGLVLVVSVLFAGLLQGGIALQNQGIPSALADVIQALVIFFVLAVRVAAQYRLVRAVDDVPPPPAGDGEPDPPPVVADPAATATGGR